MKKVTYEKGMLFVFNLTLSEVNEGAGSRALNG